MDVFDALGRSQHEFASRLAVVKPEDWDRGTPCSEWDVRALVNHVIGGCRRYTMLLHGATPDQTDALRTLDHIGGDPSASLRTAADEMMAAFHEPNALERTVHHPAGDRTGAVLAGMRVVDFTIHGWDLAQAVGADDRLDPELVDWMWAVLSGMGPALSEGGYFRAPAADAPADGTPQDRLLRLTGRMAPRTQHR